MNEDYAKNHLSVILGRFNYAAEGEKGLVPIPVQQFNAFKTELKPYRYLGSIFTEMARAIRPTSPDNGKNQKLSSLSEVAEPPLLRFLDIVAEIEAGLTSRGSRAASWFAGRDEYEAFRTVASKVIQRRIPGSDENTRQRQHELFWALKGQLDVPQPEKGYTADMIRSPF